MDEFKYEIIDDKLVIFSAPEILESEYIDNIEGNFTEVIFKCSIRKIDDFCFYNETHLERIVIPEGVTKIGASAFEKCINLREIKLPSTLEVIDEDAFSMCSIEEVIIPSNVNYIYDRAFSRCEYLKKVVLPDNLCLLGQSVFSDCFSLSDVNLPSNLKIIDSSCFDGCDSLKYVSFPEDLKEIGPCAYFYCHGLEKINFNSKIEIIDNQAFLGCEKLKEVVIPESVEYMGIQVFKNCFNLEKVVIPISIKTFHHDTFEGLFDTDFYFDSKKYKVREIRFLSNKDNNLFFFNRMSEDFVICRDNKVYYGNLAEIYRRNTRDLNAYYFVRLYFWGKKNKFIPDKRVLDNYPIGDIDNFFVNGNYRKWKELLEYADFGVEENKETLLKICYALGVFQLNSKKRDIACEYIKKYIIDRSDEFLIHAKFDGLEIENNKFDPMWAEFFMKYYRDNPDFMNFGRIELLCSSYNNFYKVRECYPSKVVNTNRYADLLTIDDVVNVIAFTQYNNVKEGDKEFSKMVGMYGYTQDQFQKMLRWFNEGRKIDKNSISLFISKDEIDENNVTYELLEKDNPLGAVLGNITNCCQVVGGAGESCVKYGMSEPNSKFMVFNLADQIIGQSWVWYDEKTGVVCLDNIEVPHKFIDIIEKDEKVQNSFIECLKRVANNFMDSMYKKGYYVSKVTVGAGYNDIKGVISKRFKNDKYVSMLNNYNGYSDAEKQYIIKKK